MSMSAEVRTARQSAETAERAVAQAGLELRCAEQRIAALDRRTQAAERRAEMAERRVDMLERQLNRPPKPKRKHHDPLGVMVELRDDAGICRVCGALAPPPSLARRDALRVCVADACRAEARRRDNNLKQRRYNERRRADQAGSGGSE